MRGGGRKFRALRLHQGNFTWAGVNFSAKTTIKSVCYNSTSNELVRTNTLVKSCIVYIDPAPFKQFLDVGMAERKNQDIIVKDENVITLIHEDKLLAKITTRPGQVGIADGYILEGPELAFYKKKLATKWLSICSLL